ncbi:MAG: hypothetical protein EPN47_10770 [Acidobacteria bacterium]|nr:MAG: hypothetical protein EPN47_10770 [Acidobacteriota bacterium]
MLLDENPTGKGYSLWLVPSEPAHSLLAGVISRLGRDHSAPRFEPHITLLGGIALQDRKAMAKLDSLARILEPVKVELGEIGFLDEYFRCLFVTVIAGSSLSSARRAACRVFARQNTPFMPHVSLLYGKLPVEMKHEIAAGLNSLSGQTFQVRRLALYKVSGSVHQWKCIKTFTLK